mmetsp:Transcript_11801/g.53513  ORF Transcript_11801/g.53513 Transcript_11801/m.53513 type:complete len:265 (+) Transcript_11801:1560-2354(+)
MRLEGLIIDVWVILTLVQSARVPSLSRQGYALGTLARRRLPAGPNPTPAKLRKHGVEPLALPHRHRPPRLPRRPSHVLPRDNRINNLPLVITGGLRLHRPVHGVHVSVRGQRTEVGAAEPLRRLRHRVQTQLVLVERALVLKAGAVPHGSLQNLQPRVSPGKVAEKQSVQPAGAEQRGIDEVRPGRRREDHNPVQPAHAVQLGEELVHHAIRDAGGVVTPPWRDGVKLVEEQRTRRGGGSPAKRVADPSLGLTYVLVEQLWSFD